VGGRSSGPEELGGLEEVERECEALNDGSC